MRADERKRRAIRTGMMLIKDMIERRGYEPWWQEDYDALADLLTDVRQLPLPIEKEAAGK